MCGSPRKLLLERAVRRDLPMPGSPESSTTWPSPLLACCQRRSSSSISSSRPTSGVRAVEHASASKRLSTALSPSTCHARTGSAKPLASIAPRSSVLEQVAEEPARTRRDHHRVRLGNRLQARRQVRRLAHDARAPGFARADQIADDHEAGGDADADLQPLERLSRRRLTGPARTARSASSSCACG